MLEVFPCILCVYLLIDYCFFFAVKPDSVVISKEDDTELKNGTILGPLTEGDEVLLTCKAVGGKPVPRVEWWNGTSPLLGK